MTALRNLTRLGDMAHSRASGGGRAARDGSA
jgi:hypothetical protein